jgi:hypothetical protein
MPVCRHEDPESSCPFAFTDNSEQAQGYGCLPSPAEIIRMRVEHGRTWACHSEPTKPCAGAIRALRARGLPHHVIDPVLVTEQTGWSFVEDAH